MRTKNIQREPDFAKIGRKTTDIKVKISYKIIQLFSEGLYRSPTKAIEELVANAFDAGAGRVEVQISPDLASQDSTILIIDDGTGMDRTGLKNHWLIGVSRKRSGSFHAPKSRKQIGRFGIGKLATYVLANRLTHITKVGKHYYSTSMNYSQIPEGDGGGIVATNPVQLPLRELTEAQAKLALGSLGTNDPANTVVLPLFGKEGPANWTVAILSDLKDMAGQLRLGRLKWILATSMPLRDDFRLYVNGSRVEPEKEKGKRIESWIIGHDIKTVPRPAPTNDLQPTIDSSTPEASPFHFGLTHPQLGRITGKAELFEDLLTGGKAEDIGRSHGFFVYVRGRLINADDEYFGISSNKLRHGTFSRFRCEVHIDRLDDELRSSRESVRQTSLLMTAQSILEGIFNVARSKHEAFEESIRPGTQAAKRVAATPYSLTRRPIISLAERILAGTAKPRSLVLPPNLSQAGKQDLLRELEGQADSPEGLIRNIETVPLSQEQGIAVFDVARSTLQINILHPFVAYFLDEFQDKARNLPLELLAVSEVLLESRLYEMGLDEETIQDLLAQRDELLRYLARSTGKRNALMISQALQEASTNKSSLELELVSAFDSMGFDAVPLGGSGKPDGLAQCSLSATKDGRIRSYKVSLEAKSKEQVGKKVTAKSVGVSTIARQRNDFGCDHAVVVGPDFPTTEGENSALAKEIKDDHEKDGKTITLIRVADMAKLVRLVPLKRLSLERIRSLFLTCVTPEQSAQWIDGIANEQLDRPPYKEILEAIAAEQKDMQEETIKYSNVQTRLRIESKLTLNQVELIELCKALSRMAPEYVFARTNTIEIQTKPKKILDAIRATINDYPKDEQPTVIN
jgi:hypothetical protein